MTKTWSDFYTIVARAPVLLGTFVSTTMFLWVHGGDGRAVVVSGVGWVVHLLSTPTIKVKQREREAHAAGRAEMAADIRSLKGGTPEA